MNTIAHPPRTTPPAHPRASPPKTKEITMTFLQYFETDQTETARLAAAGVAA